MNKAELIEKVSDKVGITKKDAAVAIETMFESITCALEKGERVRMVGFGTFETRQKAERTYVSPQSRKRVTVPASRQPVFHAGKDLKERVAK